MFSRVITAVSAALALSLALAVAAPQSAHAGKDICSTVKVKKDDWGEKSVLKISDFTWEKSNGKTTLIVTAAKGGWFVANNTTALPAGSVLEVMFADGSVWTYDTPADIMPGSAVVPYVGLVLWWDVRIEIGPEAHAVLSSKPIQAYRVTSAGNDFSKGKVSTGDGEKVRAAAACFAP
jgi:hypothetical protein